MTHSLTFPYPPIILRNYQTIQEETTYPLGTFYCFKKQPRAIQFELSDGLMNFLGEESSTLITAFSLLLLTHPLPSQLEMKKNGEDIHHYLALVLSHEEGRYQLSVDSPFMGRGAEIEVIYERLNPLLEQLSDRFNQMIADFQALLDAQNHQYCELLFSWCEEQGFEYFSFVRNSLDGVPMSQEKYILHELLTSDVMEELQNRLKQDVETKWLPPLTEGQLVEVHCFMNGETVLDHVSLALSTE